VLPILETLKDDPVLYVRRSVANHLGDILKDHPAVAYAICRRWIDEIAAPGFDPATADNRRWMIRHAVRLPAKQGERTALALRAAAKAGAQRTTARGRSAG
jgi:3-methyladenine DNA glycosylase AlkC